ncbi:MAG: hypothetical protein JW787_08580 [Sedimentisphaerales bacterium]|nr:hypothetical protein [Sedimentisphaerales bacterium]
MKKLLTDLARVLSMQFVVLLLIIGLFSLGYYFRKDIQISYHKWGQESALKSMMKYRSPTTRKEMDRIEKYSRKLQRHEKALIEIGYLSERIFETKYLVAFSPEMRKASEEFMGRHPYRLCSIGGGVTGDHEIRIICPIDMMPSMAELIKKYDVPSDDPNDE